jgi:hypothetical protein
MRVGSKAGGRVRRHGGALVVVLLGAALLLPAAASAKRADVTFRTVSVGDPGNSPVAVVPFTDAIYASCADAPPGSDDCLEVGGVDYEYEIGQLEVTVEQWVGFLNTVDAEGRNPYRLYRADQSSTRWPRYGQINRSSDAPDGEHYSVSHPEWADKPYGFATFLHAARFVNALFNGRLISQRVADENGLQVTRYRVRLSRQTERGMYNLASNRKTGATRSSETGFVIPSQDEWIKSAYYDPAGGGTLSYWKYPTNPGTFGDGGAPSASTQADAPNQTTLDPQTGDVTNAQDQPVATFHASGETAPNWCPAAESSDDCSSVNPFGLDATTYAEIYQGSVGTIGQAGTPSPWGTLDQGGNVVEWTDTITASPFGNTEGRVWRRLHGGIANAPAYQLWLSAVGLQPQSNNFYETTYPWLGFRIGVIGDLEPERR